MGLVDKQLSVLELKQALNKFDDIIFSDSFRNNIAESKNNDKDKEVELTNQLSLALAFAKMGLEAFDDDQQISLKVKSLDKLVPISRLATTEEEGIDSLLANEIPKMATKLEESLPDDKESYDNWQISLNKLSEMSMQRLVKIVEYDRLTQKSLNKLVGYIQPILDDKLKLSKKVAKASEDLNSTLAVLVQELADFNHLANGLTGNLTKLVGSTDFISSIFFELSSLIIKIKNQSLLAK
ncbi:MAG: hypothetical protein JJV97_03605 [SAR324 cluster bacterium]|nr:hypothetical protein [SAR324 cluster bacterium]